MNELITDLEARGLIHDITNREGLEKILNEDSINFYCGFDPTADSLHVGSLLPLVTMRRFMKHGHIPYLLIGDVTGMIGDPSGKSSERQLLEAKEIKDNGFSIGRQACKILNYKIKSNVYIMHNSAWLEKLSLVDFLRDTGKKFSVNSMLSRENVKSRLSREGEGISLTEFVYMTLQAKDFEHLSKFGCKLQIGGSDQYGNIVSGIDLIRRKTGEDAYGLTFPLVTKKNGCKFGKSEKGNIWLSADKTNPFTFYQFWIQTADEDVEKFLKYFSMKTLDEIEEIIKIHNEVPHDRLAQRILAQELTELVHGEDAAEGAESASGLLFNGSIGNKNRKELKRIESVLPSVEIPEGTKLVEALVAAGIAKSKRESRQRINTGGAYVNDLKTFCPEARLTKHDTLINKFLILRMGKKDNIRVVYLK